MTQRAWLVVCTKTIENSRQCSIFVIQAPVLEAELHQVQDGHGKGFLQIDFSPHIFS